VNLPLPCKSGSGNLSGQIAQGGRLSAGDAMTCTTSNCVLHSDGVDVTMNGSIFVRVSEGGFDVIQPVFPMSIGFSIAASSFDVAFQGGGPTTNGDQQVMLTRTSETAATEVLTGTALTVNVKTATGAHVSTLRNYRQTVTENGMAVSVDATATIETATTPSSATCPTS
jgi:hypothetical protein